MKKSFLLLLLTVFWLTANSQTATIQTLNGAIPGNNCSVDITLNGFSPDNIAAFQFTVHYDTTYLIFDTVSDWYTGISGVTVQLSTPGVIAVAYGEDFGVAVDGVLCKIHFTLKSNATSCYPVTWVGYPAPALFADSDYNEYTVTYGDGAVCTCNAVSITGQPADQNVCNAGNADFSVTAGGDAPFVYQWQYFNGSTWNNVVNGTPAGAVYTNSTSSTMSVSGITAAGNHLYHCYVTNCGGVNNATSNSATLAVNTAEVPTATLQTVNGAIPGNNYSVDISFDGFCPDIASFQFTVRYDTTDLTFINATDWYAGVSGVTLNTSNYYGTIHALTFGWADSPVSIDGVLCKLNFTNRTSGSCHPITWSDAPTVRLISDGSFNEYSVMYVDGQICSLCSGVSVSSQPTDQSVCNGGSADFSVALAGDAPFTYQWQYFNGSTWENVANGTPTGAVYTNANAGTMTVSGISASGTFQYHCYVTNCGGGFNATSNTASLFVGGSATPTATIQTVNGAIPGNNYSVDISLNGFCPDITSFQFTIRYDTTELTFIDATDWYAGVSGVVINTSNYYGTIHALTFGWADSPVAIDGVLCKLNFKNLTTGSCNPITWSDAPTMRLFADGSYNEYSVLYVDGQICSSCNPVTVTSHPSNQSISIGGSADFSVTAGGDAPVTYQWQYYNGSTWINVTNGTPAGAVYSNATASTMTVSGITAVGSYQYRCYLTNCSGNYNSTSNTATLTVNSGPTATIQTVNGAIPGNSIPVDITLNGFTPGDIQSFQFTIRYDTSCLEYDTVTDWYPGITGVLFQEASPGVIAFSYGESFGLVVDGVLCKINFTYKGTSPGCCPVTWDDYPTPRLFADSNYNEYVVNYIDGQVCYICTPVSITGQPANQTICTSGTTTFSVATNGSAPFTYQWQYYNGSVWSNVVDGIPAGAIYSNATTNTLAVSGITAAGSYSYHCYVSNCGGANNSTSNTATLTVNETITPLFTGLGPYCMNAIPGTLPGTSNNGITGTWIPATISTATSGTTTYNFTPTVGQCATPAAMQVVVNPLLPVSIGITADPAGPICMGTLVNFTATVANEGSSPVYQWTVNSVNVGSSSTYSSSGFATGDTVVCRLTSDLECASNNPAVSNSIVMFVKPSLTAGITIEAFDNPACTNETVTFVATPVNGGTTPAYQWYLNTTLVGTESTYSNNAINNGDSLICQLNSNEACVINNPTWSNTIHMIVNPVPVAEAGTYATYTSTPIIIGDPSSGPGTFSWSPAGGLDNPSIAQPSASPTVTTTYTLTVTSNGCIATDTVTITYGGSGHNISGKTRYAARANAGSPAPNFPTYNAVMYSIDNVIVILKTSPGGAELTRDTSDALGNYQFTNIGDGNYILSYDKYTVDSMQYGNDINAIDIALVKYYVGSDTIQDPSRCFGPEYKKAANVDNNLFINAVDIARIKSKVGAPYDPVKNFPKGNWVAMDQSVTVAGSDVVMDLNTICYGDYNASSTKYRDSLTNWGGVKALPLDFIVPSDEYVTTSDPTYFEIPLTISTKMNEFSAMGLELKYPGSDYKLVSAAMPRIAEKSGAVKINPSFEEILSDDGDLLVTDHDGVIRVVFATTNHFDVAANDEMIILGFRSLRNLPMGELEFKLSGTGVIGNQYGEENEDTYLLMPKVLVQGNTDGAFELEGYPNPFNDEANITYTLPENGMVKLKVYNAIGELVSEPVNEVQESGKHSLVFSSGNFPSGMYTFKLEFSGVSKTNCQVLKLIH